jgi:hypothetical protein
VKFHVLLECSRRVLLFLLSHLEHRASVKGFVSLQFLNLRQSVGIMRRDALNEIRTHDPSVRPAEDIPCLRPRGHCARPSNVTRVTESNGLGRRGYAMGEVRKA